MAARLLADVLVLVHLAFVAFVIGGALLTWRWPRLAWAHVPAAAWGAWVELTGRICPLTPLEIQLRRAAGEAGYEGGFIEHYLIPLLYPEGLDSDIQSWLGVLVLAVNLLAYAGILWRRARRRD